MQYRKYLLNKVWTPTLERWEVMETLALITNRRLIYIHSLLLSDDRVEFFEGGFMRVFIPSSVVIKAIDTLAPKTNNKAKLEEFRAICELTLQPLTKASAQKIENFNLSIIDINRQNYGN